MAVELTPDKELAAIRKKLGYCTFEFETRHWLDTGSQRLNSVLGSERRGLAYGKMVELSGPESNGKTVLGLKIAALAQSDGAEVGWMDTENSFDRSWAEAQGVDMDRLYLFQPKIGMFTKADKSKRLQTAEESCTEAEVWMARRHQRDSGGKLFLGVDSVNGFLVEEEALAGLTNSNMRTKVALATFMSSLLRRWVALAFNYNALIFFINQLRTAPGVVYGNPEYTTGGRALRYYSSVRANIRRVKGGRLMHQGRMIGLRGVIRNTKNKSGEGSVEGLDCGFKAYFFKNDWRFSTAAKVRKEEAGEEE